MPARYAGSTAYGGNSGEREHATIAVVSTEMRDCEIAATHGHRAAPATLRLHSAYRSRDKHETNTLLQTLVASATDATKRHCSVFLKNPALALSVDTGPPLAGCLRQVVSRTTDSTVSTTANFSPTVLGTAMTTFQRLATPAQL